MPTKDLLTDAFKIVIYCYKLGFSYSFILANTLVFLYCVFDRPPSGGCPCPFVGDVVGVLLRELVGDDVLSLPLNGPDCSVTDFLML